MTFPQLILLNLAIVAGMMFAMWIWSVLRGDASIVDPFWGFGFVVLAWTTVFFSEPDARGYTLAAMVTLWGLRLSGYLVWRNRGEPEDRRYVAMREYYGDSFWWKSLYIVFGLQGAIMWFVSLTFQAGMYYSTSAPTSWIGLLGVFVWAIGVFFESVGDYQMARFRSDPANAGKVMDRGLWRYTRHPNYFGDFCVWWGIFLVALPTGAWWTIVCPALMSFLLLRVSGVTLLEKDIADRRPAYRSYKERTSSFFPWPPRPESDQDPVAASAP